MHLKINGSLLSIYIILIVGSNLINHHSLHTQPANLRRAIC